ncbi:unnamed protein product [Cyprideis torosa]|uniref:Uncharacterized protein n=1 Tax=Cyprideis torosa TaxID=163714 RepID=A0A7R8ZMW8_9CRUS|nr:unnamed protein product [Cyprideis torosa]CAG0890056.1 unnamed protein product [Cyprideis torosa]
MNFSQLLAACFLLAAVQLQSQRHWTSHARGIDGQKTTGWDYITEGWVPGKREKENYNFNSKKVIAFNGVVASLTWWVRGSPVDTSKMGHGTCPKVSMGFPRTNQVNGAITLLGWVTTPLSMGPPLANQVDGLHFRGSPGADSDDTTASTTALEKPGAFAGDGAAEEEAIHLERRVGLFSGVALIVGTMIGEYTFQVFLGPRADGDASLRDLRKSRGPPGEDGLRRLESCRLGCVRPALHARRGTPQGGHYNADNTFCALGAMAYAELGTLVPYCGGEYSYYMEAFGGLPAYMYSWVSVIVLKPSMLGIICLSFAQYIVNGFIPLHCAGVDQLVKVVGIMTIGALSYAELGLVVPESGGEGTYLLAAFGHLHNFLGPLFGYLFNYLALVAMKPAQVAIICLTFSKYVLDPVFNALKWQDCDFEDRKILLEKLVAAACICEYRNFITIPSNVTAY